MGETVSTQVPSPVANYVVNGLPLPRPPRRVGEVEVHLDGRSQRCAAGSDAQQQCSGSSLGPTVAAQQRPQWRPQGPLRVES